MMMRMTIAMAAVFIGTAAWAAEGTGREKGVKLTEQEGVVRVEIDGKHFGDYRFDEKDVNFHRPYMFPVNASDGQCVTSDQTRTNPKEHPHHRSFWVSHGDVNGVDHWAQKGYERHVKFLEPLTGDTIKEELEWLGNDKKEVQLREVRTLRFFAFADGNRGVDLTTQLTAESRPVVLKDTKEAGLCALRVHPQMSGDKKKNIPPGTITEATGATGEKNCWGKAAKWCDYTGKIDGKTYGITIFDWPKNDRFPAHWHVRDYGLIAPNIWGLHEFDKSLPDGAGDMKIDKGQSVTFKYRVLIHTGDVKAAGVEEKFDEWAGGR